MMRKKILAIVGWATINPSFAMDGNPYIDSMDRSLAVDTPSLSAKGLIPNLFVSRDSEDFYTSRLGAAYAFNLKDRDHYQGIHVQNNHYHQNNWSKDGQQISYLQKHWDQEKLSGYYANIGVSEVSQHTLLVTDSRWQIALNKTINTELLITRDWVETQASLNQGVYYTLLGASLEHQIMPRFSYVLMAGQMIFSDSNERTLVRGRLIYDVLPEYGVNLQLRHRQYENSAPANGNYFNPGQYQETMLALGYRKNQAGWSVMGTAGVGQQKIEQEPHTRTELIELSLRNLSHAPLGLQLRAGYVKSAGFQGPNYSYTYAMGEVIFRF